jgi:hypothetical protein
MYISQYLTKQHRVDALMLHMRRKRSCKALPEKPAVTTPGNLMDPPHSTAMPDQSEQLINHSGGDHPQQLPGPAIGPAAPSLLVGRPHPKPRMGRWKRHGIVKISRRFHAAPSRPHKSHCFAVDLGWDWPPYKQDVAGSKPASGIG